MGNLNWTETISAIASPYCNLPPVDAATEQARSHAIRDWETPVGRFNRDFLSIIFWVRRKGSDIRWAIARSRRSVTER